MEGRVQRSISLTIAAQKLQQFVPEFPAFCNSALDLSKNLEENIREDEDTGFEI